MMKVLDDFLAKVGVDKILHHVIGALINVLYSVLFLLFKMPYSIGLPLLFLR